MYIEREIRAARKFLYMYSNALAAGVFRRGTNASRPPMKSLSCKSGSHSLTSAKLLLPRQNSCKLFIFAVIEKTRQRDVMLSKKGKVERQMVRRWLVLVYIITDCYLFTILHLTMFFLPFLSIQIFTRYFMCYTMQNSVCSA
jgi:hypothetical protein